MESYIHKQIHEELLKAENPVFISDERIDGDSLGAALAMVDYMHGLGKRVPVYITGNVPLQYQFLPRIDRCTSDKHVFDDETIDLVVTFDCSDGKFIGGLVDLIPADPKVINIDHHNTNPLYGHINQVVVHTAATAEVIYNFFKVNKIVPSRKAATCLLTGLCFDTSAFTNSATTESAFDAASDLILSGARVQEVIKTMFQNRSIGALRVWGLALERLYHDTEKDFVSTCLTQEDIRAHDVTEDEIDGLSNFLSLVTDTDTLFVMRETVDGDVKVSMRAQNRDVGKIAKTFGGGGHKKAAGFTVPKSKLVCDEKGQWRVEKFNKK